MPVEMQANSYIKLSVKAMFEVWSNRNVNIAFVDQRRKTRAAVIHNLRDRSSSTYSRINCRFHKICLLYENVTKFVKSMELLIQWYGCIK